MKKGKINKDLQKERDEYLEGWQRAKADFLNYKKEEAVRMREMVRYTQEEFLLGLVPILDNLERAEKQVKKKDEVTKGFLYIAEQIKGFLKNNGVQEIKSVGEKFNPELHEAVEEVQGGKAGYIVEELEKGHTFKGKLLRAAKVKVAK